jgi:hypothetical protein
MTTSVQATEHAVVATLIRLAVIVLGAVLGGEFTAAGRRHPAAAGVPVARRTAGGRAADPQVSDEGRAAFRTA